MIARLLSYGHRAALVAYPAAFRRRFATELQIAFDRRLAEARRRGGGLRTAVLGGWLLADAIASGIAERAHALRQPAPVHTGSGALILSASRSGYMTRESLFADFRLTLRQLRAAPAYAAVTIATLGLGIGATAAIFSVAHAVLLKPLPYRDPSRLVAIWSNNSHLGEPRNPVSPANFDAFRREAASFAGLEAMYSFFTNPQIERGADREIVVASTVTAGMFDLIGRPALHGRAIGRGDDQAVVLSHGYWTRAFGADPGVIGRTLTVTGAPAPFTIAGIMPADFIFPYKAMLGPLGFTRAVSPDVWVLLDETTGRMIDASGQPSRTIHMLAVIGRLGDGRGLDQARAELDTIASRRAGDFPDTNAGWSVTALPLHEQVSGRVRPAVLLLIGGVGLLLAITCLNIANVLLARATGRQRDRAVRAALGASGRRLVQQAVVESLTLSLAGGVVAVAVLYLGTGAIISLAPGDLPRLDEARFNMPVLAFALALATLTGIAVGVLPAIVSYRSKAAGVQESHRTTASRGRQRARTGLVVSEIALATMLTAGAVLVTRSFIAVLQVDPGFASSQLLTFQQAVPSRVQGPAAGIAFLDDLMARYRALPGVVEVGASTRIPLGSTQVTTQLAIEGRPVENARLPEVDMRRAVGNYFQAMRMPVVGGRVFESADRTATHGLAVVNAALVSRLFPGEEPIGKRVRMGPNPNSPWLTIIGVVGDIRHGSLEDEPRPEIYISYLQGPPTSPFFVIRTDGDPLALAGPVRQVAKDAGADPPFNVLTMDRLRSESVALRRFTVLLAGLFGVLSLVLAGVGIYGVMALVVAERRDEVGVRVALGATPARIVSMLLSQAARLGLTGVVIGLAGGLALAQLARSVLYGVGPTDWVTFVTVPTGLLAIALLAALVPARRAMRISPVDAMKS
jgi:putative ABC transport system permease protein